MGQRLLVATRKGLFRADGDGPRWNIELLGFLGVPVSMVLNDPRDGALYAALNHGHFGVKLHRSDDDGRTWNEIACPEYPPQPEDVEEVDAMGKKWEWKLRDIWALETGGANQPGMLWCGTIPGGLFQSTDHGDSWQLVRPLWDHPLRTKWFGGGTDYPALHSICVDPRDADQVRVGVSCAGVWTTDDGGASWKVHAEGMRAEYLPPEQAREPIGQDVHCLVQCWSEPDTFWVQHHNGIFLSKDYCRSWVEIEDVKPSAFGFAVAVHPSEPDTAWFVPGVKDECRVPPDGQVVVTRTRDGGKSFDVLRDGLPQEHAYDIALRHALDIDSTGNHLAFGSTTGSLWTTNDQGDHWHAVSRHLPPVYAVKYE